MRLPAAGASPTKTRCEEDRCSSCGRRASPLLCVLAWGRPEAAGAACVGDCDDSGMVTVGELVGAVNIALDNAAVDTCDAVDANGDGKCRSTRSCARSHTFSRLPGHRDDRRHRLRRREQPALRLPGRARLPAPDRHPQRQRRARRGPRHQRTDLLHARAGRPDQFIAGEDTNQGPPLDRRWGVFKLAAPSPSSPGNRSARSAHLPAGAAGRRRAGNYGCGFLSDGRLLTTDVGSQAAGQEPDSCHLLPAAHHPAIRVLQARHQHRHGEQIAVDDQDRVYVACRAPPSRARRASSATPVRSHVGHAEGGCGRVDGTGAPLVSEGASPRSFIPSDGNVQTPRRGAHPRGGFYVASVFNGVIAEYDADGEFVRRVLRRRGPASRRRPATPSASVWRRTAPSTSPTSA